MTIQYKFGVPLVLENVIHGIGNQICVTTDFIAADVLVECSESQTSSFKLQKKIPEPIKSKMIEALHGFCSDIDVTGLACSSSIKLNGSFIKINYQDYFTNICLAITEMMKRRQEPITLSQLIQKHAQNFVTDPSDSRIDSILFGGVRVSSASSSFLTSRLYHPKGLQIVVTAKKEVSDNTLSDKHSSLADFIIGCERNQLDRIQGALASNPKEIGIRIIDLLGMSSCSSLYDYGLCVNTSAAEKLQSYLRKNQHEDSFTCAIGNEGIMRY